jgi:RES domain-containing protein
MIAYRIADARHPIFDPAGAMLHGGRWNSVGQRVIYAAESYAGAMLEVLVHANLSVPPKNHRVVRITIPEQVRMEAVSPLSLAGWDSEDLTAPRRFGDRWLTEMRTAVLRVPNVITEGRENNILINPLHPEFPMIFAGEPEPIHWDARLFAQIHGR